MDVIKCANFGDIAHREHMLPLCHDCFKGLEDYEKDLAEAKRDICIQIDKGPGKPDNFLAV